MKKNNKKSVNVQSNEVGTGKTSKLDAKKMMLGWGSQIKRVNPIQSVGVKLFLIFLCSTVIVVMSLGLISYSKAKTTIKNNVSEAYRQTIVQTAEKLDITLKQYENTVLQLFFDVQLQTDLRSMATAQTAYEKFEATSSISKKLSNQTTTDSNILSVALIPESLEQEIVTSGSGGIYFDGLREQEWFKKIVADSKEYNSYYSDANNNDSKNIWFSTSLQGAEEKDIALVRSLKSLGADKGYMIMLVLKNTLLEESFASVKLGDGSRIQLVSPQGTVVASSNPLDDGKSSEFSFIKESKKNNNSLEAKDPNGKEILAVFNPMMRAD